mmetsp:Transcript_29903/g.41079  ORF Transcript_29903/g.41079 Transcript_29903/m.41079 type:complete len:212 (+) Transcript_29903:1957-2592(+)
MATVTGIPSAADSVDGGGEEAVFAAEVSCEPSANLRAREAAMGEATVRRIEDGRASLLLGPVSEEAGRMRRSPPLPVLGRSESDSAVAEALVVAAAAVFAVTAAVFAATPEAAEVAAGSEGEKENSARKVSFLSWFLSPTSSDGGFFSFLATTAALAVLAAAFTRPTTAAVSRSSVIDAKGLGTNVPGLVELTAPETCFAPRWSFTEFLLL